MVKLLAYAIAVPVALALVLAILFGLWHLWTWVMPQLFPTANELLIRPGYWLFVGVWTLTSFIGRAIFGRSK